MHELGGGEQVALAVAVGEGRQVKRSAGVEDEEGEPVLFGLAELEAGDAGAVPWRVVEQFLDAVALGAGRQAIAREGQEHGDGGEALQAVEDAVRVGLDIVREREDPEVEAFLVGIGRALAGVFLQFDEELRDLWRVPKVGAALMFRTCAGASENAGARKDLADRLDFGAA